MKIVSYNMRMGGSERHWRAVLDAFEPTVVLAQETLAPAAARGAALWAAVPGKRWGSAVWTSLGSATELRVPDFEGWVVAADVALPGREPLRIVSVHVPSGRGSYVRVANQILDRLAELPRPSACVIGGDFNLTVARRRPGEQRKNSAGELAFLQRLQSEFEVVPAWDLAHAEVPLPQTLRWTGNTSAPYHCDGVFLPSSWSPAAVAAEVVDGDEWRKLSDHNPFVVAVSERFGLPGLTPPR